MSGWWLLAGWCLGYLVSLRSVVQSMLNAMDDGLDFDGEMKAMAMFLGAVLTAGWPVVLVARQVYRWWKPYLFSDRERARVAEGLADQMLRERDEVIAWAASEGLSWPETEDERVARVRRMEGYR